MKDSSHKMHSLEGGSKGRDRFTPQQHLKSHQRNSSFRKGSHPPGSYSQNHISHRSFNGRDSNDQHDLSFTIAKQIEYYFSPESLWKNISLRQHMDEQGWVPVSVIARFHPVEQLMKGIPDNDKYILGALKASKNVETNGDKIRKRYDWIKWILPQSVGVPKDGNSANPEMNNHLRRSNRERRIEGIKMKDCLEEFSAWDKIEDLQKSFSNFTWKLPEKMEAHDQQMVVAAMKVLLDDLLGKYNSFKTEFDGAAKSSSEWIFELIGKHPYIVERRLFQEYFSDVVETPEFQKIFASSSDEDDADFELLDTTISENKGKNEEPDVQRVEVLQQNLFKKLLDYNDMIAFVKCFIRSVEKKDIV